MGHECAHAILPHPNQLSKKNENEWLIEVEHGHNDLGKHGQYTFCYAARDYIRNQGYGEYFGHGLGHGIGLAVHEDPVVNFENKGPVQEGMIFTIEPGIYLPDRGGVRIEDMVRVTSHGAEVLTYLPCELKEH